MNSISPPVIYFHSVAPAPRTDWMLNFLTFEMHYFEDQLAFLKDKRYRAVFLDEWLAVRQGGQAPDGKAVCLTFDDGLLDNWVYVFPLICKYGLRCTLFVAPEWIDTRETVRPTLEDVWAGRCRMNELDDRGFISWPEIRLMVASGCVDIQSHTMSHDKFPAGPELEDFYYGDHRGFYTIINTNPGNKPWYQTDPDFARRIPYGTPMFRENSAVVVRKIDIDPDFHAEVHDLAARSDLENPGNRAAFEATARRIHQDYLAKGLLVRAVESEASWRKRLAYEILESKSILEAQTGQPVRFLCWPHGDNSAEAHAMALEAGYLATTAGKMTETAGAADRIPRFGSFWRMGHWMNRRKLHYKLASHYHKEPWYAVWRLNEAKNRMLGRS